MIFVLKYHLIQEMSETQTKKTQTKEIILEYPRGLAIGGTPLERTIDRRPLTAEEQEYLNQIDKKWEKVSL